MPYIVYSVLCSAPVARWDGRLSDIALRPGEVAIPCEAEADPNNATWGAEAADYGSKYELDNARTLATERIDSAAAAARARYITTGAGQEATYLTKEREADAFVAAGRPSDTSAYPMLVAEAAGCGTTIGVVADLVRATRNQWVPLAATIEGLRMGGKSAVAAANDVQAILLITETILDQLRAL